MHWPLFLHWLPQLATARYTHAPVVGSQLSMVHTLSSLQTTAVPTHLPLWQASPPVQAKPSEQPAPFVAAAHLHTPLAWSQVSIVQGLLSSQVTVLPVWHAPALQLSPAVQALPSEQPSPSATADAHSPFWQISMVQTLLSLQSASTAHLPPQPIRAW